MPGFLDIPHQYTHPETARVQIIPVPYDATSTYRKGSDRGPQAIIDASAQVEWFDIETGGEHYQQGIHTQQPVVCNEDDPVHLAPLVRQRVAAALDGGKLPVVIGGEHSVTIGAVEAAASRMGPITTLQIDAHGDTRDSYHGSKYNHACVMARAKEHGSIVQVGIRAIDRQELDGMDRKRVYFAHEIARWERGNDDSWMDRVIDQLEDHVYLTIDLDALDPSILPSTGTPEPGGLGWYTVNELVRRVARNRRIVGFDVVELCPNESHHASDFIAAKLVYRVMCEILAAEKA
ncbi:MAG: agmatinase [Phycisphaerales bacterium]